MRKSKVFYSLLALFHLRDIFNDLLELGLILQHAESGMGVWEDSEYQITLLYLERIS